VSVRAAAEIGAGLEPARPARPIRPGERIHVVGAQGAGASAAALLAAWSGAEVDGCDPGGPSQYTPALDAAGIVVAGTHEAAHVTREPHPGRLAVTKALTAIDPDNPELLAARALGIPLEPWQQVVADAAAGRVLIAVAGTHGKSTTSGWLVHALVGAGGDPGGPDVIVLTSAEWDHPDVFPDGDAVIAAFEAWIRRASAGRAEGDLPVVLVANTGDAGVAALVRRLDDWPGLVVRTALDPGPHDVELAGHVVAADPDGTLLRVTLAGEFEHEVRLTTAGRHNAANALGVIGACLAAGYEPEAVLAGVASFTGVGRRLERKGEVRGVVVYDDYGHHPTAIRETLAAVRQREPGRRVWAVYEPLTYHRTAALLDAFAEVLAAADAIAIADIWAGRDPDTTVASAAGLAAAVAQRAPGKTSVAPGSVEETAAWLAGAVRDGDVVLVMGGGRSYRIGELLLELLEAG